MSKIKNLVLLFLSVLILAACAEEKPAEEIKEVKAASVETSVLKAEPFAAYINVVGAVKPNTKAILSYTESGEVKKVVVDKGAYVKKGDVIIEMDNTMIRAGRDAAKAQYELAKVTFEKQSEIFKQKVNSEIEYLQSKFNMEQAKANYEQLNDRYEKTFIKSPIDGKVNKRYYDEGEMVLPGSPVVEVIDIKKIKVEAGIPERYATDISKGGDVMVAFPSVESESWPAKITFVGSAVSIKNRTFPVEVVLDNPGQKIKPEMLADLKILQSKYDDVVTVPEEVVLRDADSFIVFIAKNGRAVAKNIKILKRYDGKIAVSSGLNAGDSLIVMGYQSLVHDEKILVVN